MTFVFGSVCHGGLHLAKGPMEFRRPYGDGKAGDWPEHMIQRACDGKWVGHFGFADFSGKMSLPADDTGCAACRATLEAPKP